jgi:hypothetical protein
MICTPATKSDIAVALGVDTRTSPSPSWSKADHLYTWDYLYAGGFTMALSVKELSSAAQTTSYFDALGQRLGRAQSLQGLGEGGYTTSNGSAVVRKDYKVLFIDTSRLPTQFGAPPETRINIATSVAATIMGCWSGA